MTQYFKQIAKALSVVVLMASCSSNFLEEYSQDLSRVKTADDIQELVTGSCNLPLGLFGVQNHTYVMENRNYDILHFMSDELEENIPESGNPDVASIRDEVFPFFTWQKNTGLNYEGQAVYKSNEANYWDLLYERINNCNMAIAAVGDVKADKKDDKLKLNRAEGECYFLRAFYCLTLVNLYADPYTPASASTTAGVPMKTTEYVEDKEYSRNSVAEVYAQIVSDLTNAEKLLSNTGKQSSIYHADLNCVYLLRSRVALYMQDWATAKDYAERSLAQNSTLQNLVGADESTYPINKDNPEVIYSNGSSCFGNMLFQSPERSKRYMPVWTISEHLYNLYTGDDGRRTSYITTKDDVADGKPTYHKIDNSTTSYLKYKTVSDVFSMRTAEAYLNLAEAEAELGNDANACKQLNMLRAKRIANPVAIALIGEQLITAVREERERELCLEGHRWFDLRRYMVDAKYPYSKEIKHTYTTYVYRDYEYYPQQTLTYVLGKNDKGYTLNIPSNVREFQLSIGSNERPDRPASSTEEHETPEEEE